MRYLCVGVYAGSDDHLEQLEVVDNHWIDLLCQLGVETEERDLLHFTACPTAICQGLRLANLHDSRMRLKQNQTIQ